jgi:hypothetical protein
LASIGLRKNEYVDLNILKFKILSLKYLQILVLITLPPFTLKVVTSSMATSSDQVLVYSQSIQTNWSSGVYLIGADANFSAKSIPHSIGEPCRCIPKHSSTIDTLREQASSFF